MSGTSLISRIDRSTIGNSAVGAAFVVIALIFLDLQKGSLGWGDPGAQRVLGALAVLIVYLLFCASLFARRQLAKRKSRSLESAAHAARDPAGAAPILIVHASQTGFAEQLAGQTAESLRSAGTAVEIRSIDDLDEATLARAERALFIASTTGEGDPPDSAMRFLHEFAEREFSLQGLRYGVLALGDSEYVNYCAFGHRIDQWLRQRGASALFDAIEVDNGDEGALRHWQHQLGLIAENPDLADWQAPRYAKWRLIERSLLNPGSVGDPCFHLALQPLESTDLRWSAGDIAEIGPRNSAQDVADVLAQTVFSAGDKVDVGAGIEALSDVIARSHLPERSARNELDAAGFAASLKPLPHREYSIASIPSDGALHLLVRQMHRADGRLGLGSGWLGKHAPLGAEIAMRVRGNSNFHLPDDARPIILIGNGTGLAGLRALLKQRISNAQYRNWLIFGERNAAHDYYHREELERWRSEGKLERLDLAFSRDQATRIYVQDRLRAAAEALNAWVADGASIYVCGSLDGMAPAVDAVLRESIGADLLEKLLLEQRYRRDVY